MAVHVVRVGPFMVDANGNRVDKNNPETKIKDVLRTNTDFLVIPDAAIPNSANYPTIKTYIELEASGGYKVQHLDQSYIITYNT